MVSGLANIMLRHESGSARNLVTQCVGDEHLWNNRTRTRPGRVEGYLGNSKKDKDQKGGMAADRVP